jgi:hypothetical protein
MTKAIAEDIIRSLKIEFKIAFSEARHYIRPEIDQEKNNISISQEKYIKKTNGIRYE